MEEQTITDKEYDVKGWLLKELEETKDSAFDEDRKPALKLEENKTCKMTINFSEPFQKWEDTENHTIKKIIPVKVNGEEFVWWLNVRNPIYGKILELGSKGQTEFKVVQTGNQKNTKYILVDD